jgi:hypothetical protein
VRLACLLLSRPLAGNGGSTNPGVGVGSDLAWMLSFQTDLTQVFCSLQLAAFPLPSFFWFNGASVHQGVQVGIRIGVRTDSIFQLLITFNYVNSPFSLHLDGFA